MDADCDYVAAPFAKLRAIFPNTVLDKDRDDFRARARRVLDGPSEKDFDYLEDLELGWPRGEPNALSVYNPNNRRPALEPAEAARVDAYMQALRAVSYDEWVGADPQPDLSPAPATSTRCLKPEGWRIDPDRWYVARGRTLVPGQPRGGAGSAILASSWIRAYGNPGDCVVPGRSINYPRWRRLLDRF